MIFFSPLYVHLYIHILSSALCSQKLSVFVPLQCETKFDIQAEEEEASCVLCNF